MQKDNEPIFQDENSCFNCIGEMHPNNTSTSGSKLEIKMLVEENSIQSIVWLAESLHASFMIEMKDIQEQSYKRPRKTEERDEEDYTENSSSNEIKSKKLDSREEGDKGKVNYMDKQHIYSKNYRQRNKQKVKSLEEENEFLKKKIQDLEFRLWEMQLLQVNRLKFTPEEKQFTIEQLNSEFMEKVTVIMEKNKDDVTYHHREKNHRPKNLS